MKPKPRSAFHIFKVPVAIALYSPSPSGRRISTSAKEAHALNSAAPLATILNDVLTFSVGGAFLKLHCLFAYDADQETYEWTFIVVQMMSPGHSHRRETWKPLLLKKLPLTTNLLLRGPPAKLRLLAGDSETNRALELFPLRLLPSFPCDKACPIFRIGRVSLGLRSGGAIPNGDPIARHGPPVFRPAR